MDIRAVIMSGGIGARFWPLSRQKKPKQFISIISEKTLIEETISRLFPRLSYSDIYTVANSELTQTIKTLFADLPEENLIIEPQAKNTAPSLILATAKIYLQNPKALVAALPADHLIKNSSLFLKKIEAGALTAAKGENLVVFGIPPAYPATGYGYIQYSPENPQKISDESFFKVLSFKEKPRLEQAESFIEDGNYFWNSGIFLWQAEIFSHKLEQYAPSLFPFWEGLLEALAKKSKDQVCSIFEKIPHISIDYALMEKAKGVLMCKGDFGWSDVGSWSSLADIWPKDKNGNATRGDNILLDAHNCLLYNPQKLTALVGVQDIIVIDTEDALLVCHKDQDQKVKDIVNKIKEKNKKQYI
jgi:mannose-1-phosphate guanylyltransferase